MSKLELYLPTKPSQINQAFGGNPEYYARFLDRFGNPEKGHMGIDFKAAHATPLYATHDGQAFYVSDAHGGDGIYIQTDLFDYEGTEAYFWIINWHLCSKDDPQYKPLIPTDGTRVPVKAGQLIGYTDNTGAPFESSGDHLHFGLMPIHADGTPFDPHNGFDGCIDATPYLLNIYAGDIQAVENVVTAAAKLTQNIAADPAVPVAQKLTWIQEISEAIKAIEQSLF